MHPRQRPREKRVVAAWQSMSVTLVDFGPLVWRDAKEQFARVTGPAHFHTPAVEAAARPGCRITSNSGMSPRDRGVLSALGDLSAGDATATPAMVTESFFSTAPFVSPGFIETGDHTAYPPPSTTNRRKLGRVG
jgi:hypothetical protein